MNLSLTTVLVGALLLLIQLLAALPWLVLAFFKREDWLTLRSKGGGLLDNPLVRRLLTRAVVALAAVGVGPILFGIVVQEKSALEVCGYLYAVVLQVQLLVDFFILAFALLLWLWPKGGAVALAAFREGVRQSMFWLLCLLAFLMTSLSPLIPYYTFGEDHLVVKDIGHDTIMMAAVVFGALAASMFVSDEIEGRTAVTLMSKPVSRRQFLLGKFVGIILAVGVMFALLGTYFEGVLLFQRNWWNPDRLDPQPTPAWVVSTLDSLNLPGEATDLLRGVGLWTSHTLDTLPGLVLAFSQVMVLVAIAVSLATRVPMVVNLTVVLVVYFLAHLTPVLQTIAHGNTSDSAVAQLLRFVADLFGALLPDLDSFRIDPALLGDNPPPAAPFARYIGSVSLYGLLYTGIALLFGLILFEDRDLA